MITRTITKTRNRASTRRPAPFVFVIVFLLAFPFSPADAQSISSCPSAADTFAARTELLTATIPTLNFIPATSLQYNPVFQQGSHCIFTTPAQDRAVPRLSVLPPDGSPSMKLNDSNVGDLSVSAARYRLDVDTAVFRTLILRYAAVMQNPDHAWNEQPRFTFDILDSTLTPVDTDCYSADFISDTALGWDTVIRTWPPAVILWKDWTSICIDLSNLHGQTIYIFLAAYDCARGAHFGYAYYSFACADLTIERGGCGRYRHYTAPEGFTYHWYPEGRPWDTLDNGRTCITSWTGNVCCELGYEGAQSGRYCYSTLTASPVPVPTPVAACSVDTIDTIGCSVRIVVHDSSSIFFPPGYDTTDTSYRTLSTSLLVDSIIHAPGDTITLTQGSHTITLIAALDTLLCNDDTAFHITVTDFCHCYDTLSDTIGTPLLPYFWHGATFTGGGDTTITLPGAPNTCDTIRTLHLHIYPNSTDTAYLFLCLAMVPYAPDTGVLLSGDTIVTLRGRYGQDSTIHYRVTILHDSDTAIVDSILEGQLPWFYFDTLFTDSVTNHPFHLVNEAGCDSIVYYTLYVFWDGDHCDTSLTFPTLVTPNGDGINDRFVIGGLLENNCFKFNDLLIYDRTGQLVYHGHNIATEADFWDPAAHRAPDATYFYVFKAHGVTIHTMHQGLFEVLR